MRSRVFQANLASIVWPVREGQFLKDYWQKKPLFVRGSARRLRELARVLHGLDLLAILQHVNLAEIRLVTRYLPRVPPGPVSDLGALLALYEAGVQLYIATSKLAGMQPWLDALTQGTGTLRSHVRSDIYATRRGGGIGLHFDSNENFTIQLGGTKEWEYTENEHYPNPLHNFFTGVSQQLIYDPTCRSTVPQAVSGDLVKVVLQPGDMLYLPAGFWHRTEAHDESLSLNLSMNPVPWTEVVADALQVLLVRQPAWRAMATRDPAIATARMNELGDVLAALQPDDLLATAAAARADHPAIDGSTRLRRNPLVWWHAAPGKERGTMAVVLVFPDRTRRRLVMPRRAVTALDKLPSDGRCFQVRAWLGRSAARSEDLLELAKALVTVGLLAVVPGGEITTSR